MRAFRAPASFINQDLQALRGLSIFFVVYYHIVDIVPGLKEAMGFAGTLFHGAHGVDLFFTISGYVITRSIYRHIDHDGRVRATDGFRFWVRRAFRTLPPAALWLALVLAVVLATGWYGPADVNVAHAKAALGQYANYFMYTCVAQKSCGVFGYYWSLSTEEQFYVLLPITMVLLPKKALAWFMLMGGVCLAVLYSTVPTALGLDFRLVSSFPLRFDGLMLGVALALFQDAPVVSRAQRFLTQKPKLRFVS